MENSDVAREDRRKFLVSAGKFVVAVPPAMTFLLSTTLSSEAIAKSSHGNEGCGNDFDPDNTGNNREDPPGCEGRDDGN